MTVDDDGWLLLDGSTTTVGDDRTQAEGEGAEGEGDCGPVPILREADAGPTTTTNPEQQTAEESLLEQVANETLLTASTTPSMTASSVSTNTNTDTTTYTANVVEVPAPSSHPAQWAEQLQTLHEMGFDDVDRCVSVLERLYLSSGLDAVVDDLLRG